MAAKIIDVHIHRTNQYILLLQRISTFHAQRCNESALFVCYVNFLSTVRMWRYRWRMYTSAL